MEPLPLLTGKAEIPFDFKFAAPRRQIRPLVFNDPSDLALVTKSANASEKFRRKLIENYIATENAFMDIKNVSNINGNVLELPDLPRDAAGNASMSDTLRALGKKRLGKSDLLKLLVAETLRRKPITGISPEKLAELVQAVQDLKAQQNIPPEAKQELLREEIEEVAEEAIADDDGEGHIGDRGKADGLEALNHKVQQILDFLNQVMARAMQQVKDEDEVLQSSEPNDPEDEIVVLPAEGEEGYVPVPSPKVKEEEEVEEAEEDEPEPKKKKGYKYVFTEKKGIANREGTWAFSSNHLKKNPRLKPNKKGEKPYPFNDDEDSRPSQGRRLYGDYTWSYQGERKTQGSGIIHYSNPAELVPRLEVLLGELNAGNDSKTVINNITAIADTLLKNKAISIPVYKAIYRKLDL